jgi:L-ribulose-5-phosphate 3-epimerase
MTSKIRLGVMVNLNSDFHEEFRTAREMGFDTCQLLCWNSSLMTDEYAEKVNAVVKEYGAEITAFWCGWPGPTIWNFIEGPVTLGLVPPAYRFARMETLVRGSDFARKISVTDVITHAGFIPENPNDPDYAGVVSAVRYIAQHCKANGQYFLFETGQETPVVLKRTMEDVGLDNLGVNLDPANLLLYGKANPVDALDILGPYVRGVHAKDGEYPVNGQFLGEEKPLGMGRVNFPALIARLKEYHYTGALTIEREISGEQQKSDILAGKKLLEALL